MTKPMACMNARCTSPGSLGRRSLVQTGQMPSSSAIAAFAALSFALIVVPGPSVMFVVSRALTVGRRAALITVAGNAVGVFIQVVAVAVGLGAVVERSALAFTTIKLAGAGYLIWLGLQAIRQRREMSSALDVAPDEMQARSVFRDGFIVGVANPKSIVFFAAILPQYVDASDGPVGLQMVLLGIVFVGVALLSDTIWGIAAGAARDWLSGSPKRLERIGGLGGLAMVGLGTQLALTGRKD